MTLLTTGVGSSLTESCMIYSASLIFPLLHWEMDMLKEQCFGFNFYCKSKRPQKRLRWYYKLSEIQH